MTAWKVPHLPRHGGIGRSNVAVEVSAGPDRWAALGGPEGVGMVMSGAGIEPGGPRLGKATKGRPWARGFSRRKYAFFFAPASARIPSMTVVCG